MSLHNLATVFGPTLLRPSEGESKVHLTLASDIWSHDVMAQVRAGYWRGSPACLDRFVTFCWINWDKLGGGSYSPFCSNTPHLPSTGPGPSLLPAASSHFLHGAQTQHTLLLHGRVARRQEAPAANTPAPCWGTRTGSQPPRETSPDPGWCCLQLLYNHVPAAWPHQCQGLSVK